MPPKKNKETVHWSYNNKIVDSISKMPQGVYGFCYMITVFLDNVELHYIGQKKLISRRKKKMNKKEIEQLKNKRSKKWYWVETEMDWQNYCGSNKPLLELIKLYGHEKLSTKKEILHYAFSELQLKYLEAKEILCNGCLEDDKFFNDGCSIRQYGKLKF